MSSFYCPECLLGGGGGGGGGGGTIVHLGALLKMFLSFGLRRDLIKLNATDT